MVWSTTFIDTLKDEKDCSREFREKKLGILKNQL
jgi:hypothetical protein